MQCCSLGLDAPLSTQAPLRPTHSLLLWAQTLAATALPPRTFTCWDWLEAGLCPQATYAVQLARSLPGSLGPSAWPQAGWSPHLASRGQQAPDQQDCPEAGDLANTQQTVLGVARPRDEEIVAQPGQASSPTLGRGTMENGAPLFLATASPQPRKENSFSGHMCPCVA